MNAYSFIYQQILNFISMQQNTKKIVVVGGGFAGLNFISSMKSNPDFRITLVDSNNYNHFSPLLYQVATAFIEASNICYPFRKLFQGKSALRFHLGSLISINNLNNTIQTETESIEYDYLVLAIGTETNYFGIENVKEHALPMKTVDDALNLRNHLLLSFEKAVQAIEKLEKEKYLNVVIAGGGPSGVEVAGMLAEMRQYLSKKEYPEFKNLRTKVFLVDMASVLLSPMSQTAQKEAKAVLTKLGVDIRLNTAVKDYIDKLVILDNGETISTNTLIWTSGVIGKQIIGLPNGAIGHGRRVIVNQYNQIAETPNIFAIGDIALQTTDINYPNGHPQVAQVAIQQGNALANNILCLSQDQELKAFTYKDKGSMAIISKYKAVADLPKFSFKGFFAWLIWLFIHILPIAGFRNKVKLSINWFWHFITNNPSLRLIIRPAKSDKTMF